MSAAATSPTGAFFKVLRAFTEDSWLNWLETDVDATPATNRAKAAANFMLAASLSEQKRNTEWKSLNKIFAHVNWKLKHVMHANLINLTTMHLPKQK